jgi:conjugative transfer signal peptidase TraF
MKLFQVIGLFGFSADQAGLGINATHSAPIGLWTAQPFDPSSLRRGMTVLVCPPDQPVVREMRDRGYLSPGDCPHTHVMQLGKTIRAIPGDVVRIEAGMPATVNGFPLPNSIARPSLPAWPQGEYAVQPGEVWIFSSYSADSFDSRYFGPVNPSAIRSETAPWLVYGNRETL